MQVEDRIIRLISSKHVLDTLRDLRKSDARFSELETVFPSERLRCIRLGELEELGIIKRIAEKRGKKTVLVYVLTEKGSIFLDSIDNAIKIITRKDR